MPFAISFVDDPRTTRERKQSFRDVHIAYVTENAHRIIASGGLFPDDDDFPNGGLILLDVQTRAQAVDYIENDPFFLNRIFSRYTIHRWKKFVFDHQRVS